MKAKTTDFASHLTAYLSVHLPGRVNASPNTVASYRDIVLGTHGVVLEKRGRSAVFLPQVATETGWTLDQFLSHLAQKAGLGASDWKEGATFRVFTAAVIHE